MTPPRERFLPSGDGAGHYPDSGMATPIRAGLALAALALLLAPLALLWSAPAHDASGWLRLLAVSGALALFASVIGNGFWNAASRRLPLSLSGQMIVFETLFAFLYGFIWEQRGPSLIELLAIALMITSVIWCVRAHRPTANVVTEVEH